MPTIPSLRPTAETVPVALALVALALALAAPPAAAQDRRRAVPGERYGGAYGDTGEGGVILYRDLALSGVSERFTRDVPDLRGSRVGDDQTSSVRVEPGCRARLYQHPGYGGNYVEVADEIRDLRGSRVGDDGASSVRVRCGRDYGWDEPQAPEPDRPGRPGRPERYDGGVTLYRDLSFGGRKETFYRDVPDLRGSFVGDDQATSVRVDRGCRARLYQHPGYRGGYTEVLGDEPDLRRSRVGDDGTSSLQVRCGRDGFDDGGYGERGVTLYRDLSFTGVAETFTRDAADLRGSRIGDDHATSVALSRGCRAWLYRDPGFGGEWIELRGDEPDLRGTRVGDDSISSLRVECD